MWRSRPACVFNVQHSRGGCAPCLFLFAAFVFSPCLRVSVVGVVLPACRAVLQDSIFLPLVVLV